MECETLDMALKEHAFEEAAPFAPSNRLEVTLSNDDKMALDVDDNCVEESVKDGLEPMDTAFKSFRVKGTKHCQAAADLAIVKLFCVAGLPTYLATYPEWHNLLTTLWPTYKPADHTKLEDVQIVAEAAFVWKVLDILRVEEDLTVSYDGGTSRGHEAFWTIHVSTSDHCVYFVAGWEATCESHTSLWIRNTVNMVHIISALSPSLMELTFLFR